MKTYKVSTSATSSIGAGRMFLIKAEDKSQVIAWFAMNYGLATIDLDSITVATAEDEMYYASTHGRVHQTNARQRLGLLYQLDAVPSEDYEKVLGERAKALEAFTAPIPSQNLVINRDGDDTTWYVVSDEVYDKIEAFPEGDKFEPMKFMEFVWGLILDAGGSLRPGIARYHTQDFVTEKVNPTAFKRIVTLPAY